MVHFPLFPQPFCISSHALCTNQCPYSSPGSQQWCAMKFPNCPHLHGWHPGLLLQSTGMVSCRKEPPLIVWTDHKKKSGLNPNGQMTQPLPWLLDHVCCPILLHPTALALRISGQMLSPASSLLRSHSPTQKASFLCHVWWHQWHWGSRPWPGVCRCQDLLQNTHWFSSPTTQHLCTN